MYPLEQALGPRIKRISNALDRKRTLDIEDMELTSSQGMVLGFLSRRGGQGVNPGDICRHFGLAHPTVTGILQRLEAKGFIRFTADPEDRRRKQIAVTEKALDCQQRLRARFLETETQMTAGLEPEELERLRALLDRVIENIGAGCDGCGSSRPKEESK